MPRAAPRWRATWACRCSPPATPHWPGRTSSCWRSSPATSPPLPPPCASCRSPGSPARSCCRSRRAFPVPPSPAGAAPMRWCARCPIRRRSSARASPDCSRAPAQRRRSAPRPRPRCAPSATPCGWSARNCSTRSPRSPAADRPTSSISSTRCRRLRARWGWTPRPHGASRSRPSSARRSWPPDRRTTSRCCASASPPRGARPPRRWPASPPSTWPRRSARRPSRRATAAARWPAAIGATAGS